MELIFATHNQHKFKELLHKIPAGFQLKSLQDFNFYEDIPETKLTLEENSLDKANYVFQRLKSNCFADDTGLEVDALNGEPGVFSARYAGSEADPKKNMRKLLDNLTGIENRKARFRTVISLIIDDKIKQFEGIVNGKIIEKEIGTEGFGYDPVFLPDGYNQTFAEMPLDLKNQISHRALAVNKLLEYLRLI